MKFKILLTILALCIFNTSCKDDFLEEEVFTFQAPKDYYSNENEVKASVNGMYDALMTWELWVQPAWVPIALENDDMLGLDWISGGYTGNQNGQWYIERPWKGFYQVINRANNVIDRVSKLEFLSEEAKNAALGQAYFMRGYCYFELGRWYGDAPIRTKSYDPAVDSPDLARSSVEEVYAQASSDLETAAGFLPESFTGGYYGESDRGRPTAPAAWGLLAKVKMNIAGAQVGNTAAFTDALAACKEVVNLSTSNGFPKLEAEYMDNFLQETQDGSDEMLFSIQATQAPNEGPEIARFYTPGNASYAGGGGLGGISMREDFYNTFEDNDARVSLDRALFGNWTDLAGVSWYNFRSLPSTVIGITSESVFDNGFGRFGDNTYLLQDGSEVRGTPRLFIRKYVDETSQVKDENGANPIIVRYADVLLLLAESENEVNGPTATAYDAINQVRQRAGLENLTDGLSIDDFRTAVRLERRHELYGEFQRRWDLVRWGIWMETMEAANRPRQDYQKLFPISAEEIAANAMINENNPGW